jgi:hypothetical protein
MGINEKDVPQVLREIDFHRKFHPSTVLIVLLGKDEHI